MPIARTISIVDWQHYMEQVTIVTLMEINRDMPSPYARGVVSVHDPTRFHGGNWQMQGFRRSGHIHDETVPDVDC